MEPVDIFCRINREHDFLFINVRGWRGLHQNAMNRRISVQFGLRSSIDRIGRLFRKLNLPGEESELLRSPVFIPDIGHRRRIISHEHDRQSRRDSTLFNCVDFARESAR